MATKRHKEAQKLSIKTSSQTASKLDYCSGKALKSRPSSFVHQKVNGKPLEPRRFFLVPLRPLRDALRPRFKTAASRKGR
jgi:hypothetical protein